MPCLCNLLFGNLLFVRKDSHARKSYLLTVFNRKKKKKIIMKGRSKKLTFHDQEEKKNDTYIYRNETHIDFPNYIQ